MSGLLNISMRRLEAATVDAAPSRLQAEDVEAVGHERRFGAGRDQADVCVIGTQPGRRDRHQGVGSRPLDDVVGGGGGAVASVVERCAPCPDVKTLTASARAAEVPAATA